MLTNWIARLRGIATPIRAGLGRHKKLLLLVAGSVFSFGLVISLKSLDLDHSDIALIPAAISLLLLAPLSVAFSAVALQISAVALKRKVGFRDALLTVSAGDVAEILPVPASAVFRGVALVRAGASVRDSTWIVALAGVLWIGMAFLMAGLALIHTTTAAKFWFIGLGTSLTSICFAWIWLRSGATAALAMLGHRLANLLLAVIRLKLVFAAISVSVLPYHAALMVLAVILGSASSIAPGGLGISESIAAVLATFVTVSPAAAFAAVGLNRIAGLMASGVIAFWLTKTGAPLTVPAAIQRDLTDQPSSKK